MTSTHPRSESELLLAMAKATTTVEQRTIAAELEEARAHKRAQAEAARMSSLSAGTLVFPDHDAERHVSTASSDWLADIEVPQADRTEMEHQMRAEATVWLDSRPAEVRADGGEFRIQATSKARYLSNHYPGQREAAEAAFLDQIQALAVEDWARPDTDAVTVQDAEQHEEVEFEGDTADVEAETSASDTPSLAEGTEPESDEPMDGNPANPNQGQNYDDSTFNREDAGQSVASRKMAASTSNLSVGDRVMLTQDGKEREFEVTSVSPSGSTGRAESAGPRVTVTLVGGKGYSVSFDNHSQPGISSWSKVSARKTAATVTDPSSLKAGDVVSFGSGDSAHSGPLVKDEDGNLGVEGPGEGEWTGVVAYRDGKASWNAVSEVRTGSRKTAAWTPTPTMMESLTVSPPHRARAITTEIARAVHGVGPDDVLELTVNGVRFIVTMYSTTATTDYGNLDPSGRQSGDFTVYHPNGRSSEYYFGPSDSGGWAAAEDAANSIARKADMLSRSASRKTAVSLSNVGVESDTVGTGTDPSGRKVRFSITAAEAKQLKSILSSDMAINFSGVDVEESDVIKGGGRKTAISDAEKDKVIPPMGYEVTRADVEAAMALPSGSRPRIYAYWDNGTGNPQVVKITSQHYLDEYGPDVEFYWGTNATMDNIGDWMVSRASRRHAAESQTCSVCGDKIARDPEGGGGYHHDNGEKHDHEAKPSAEAKEGSRRKVTASDEKVMDFDPNSSPLNARQAEGHENRMGHPLKGYYVATADEGILKLVRTCCGENKEALAYEAFSRMAGGRTPFGRSPRQVQAAVGDVCWSCGGKGYYRTPMEDQWGGSDSGQMMEVTCSTCGGSGVVNEPDEYPLADDPIFTGSRNEPSDDAVYRAARSLRIQPEDVWAVLRSSASSWSLAHRLRIQPEDVEYIRRRFGRTASRKVDTSRRTAGGGEAWQAAQEGGHASQVEFALSMWGVPEDQIDSATQDFLAQWDGSGDAGGQAQQWYDSRTASRKTAREALVCETCGKEVEDADWDRCPHCGSSAGAEWETVASRKVGSTEWVHVNSGDPGAVRDIYEKVLPGGDSLEVSVDRQSGRASWNYVSREGYFTGGSGTEATLEAAKAAAEASLGSANAGHGPAIGSRRKTSTSKDVLRQIEARDPDGQSREPRQEDYDSHERWAIKNFGQEAWDAYIKGGWDQDRYTGSRKSARRNHPSNGKADFSWAWPTGRNQK